ncbi:hypothetical protein [Nitratireductor sp. XY-223]|uniref:hypothetical protein n=1 Tax=Nitratireductor sp. XY-223 TaxID=2561926 RepID=UPI00198085A7|nr:hypothetical protein [Nitratireductor sp. XY-223]
MEAVDQALLDAYLAFIRDSGKRTPQQVARIVEIAIDLHRHGEVLTLGGYSCRPWRGRSASRIAGCPRDTGENRTPRIPEPVIDVLLRWAVKYVDHFTDDILAAAAERERLERKRQTTRAATRTVVGKFDSYVRARRRAGRGIPVRSVRAEGEEPDFNFPLIAAQVGCSTGMLYHPEAFRAHLSFAADWIGVEIGGMDTPISNDPDTGEPWRARFDNASIDHEQRMLQAACYIVCAYLSGMRDSEIQAMRLNCLDVTRSADGVIERYRVRSLAYKGRGARGHPEEWITIAPVARAIDVLKRLSAAARRKRGTLSLWPMLSDKGPTTVHLGTGVNALLNDFRAHLDAAYGDETAPIVPAIDGKTWRLTTRQFRRTVAWFIANRPFGAVAGKIQYKHASIAMFEGYAGGGEADFKREIEQERALGQLDDIVDHYEDFRRGLKPTGPASARILAEFEQVKDKLGDLPGRIVDRQRLRAMLTQLARTLHVGLLNDCFFDPATAYCLDRTKVAERGAPMLSHCSPDRCPNACISRRHLAPWRDSIADGEALLKDKRLSVLQRRALREEIARKQKLIAPLAEETA